MLGQAESSTPWYASGLFWAIAGVAATVVAIVVGTMVAHRAANPRRRLHIYLESTFPLLRPLPRGEKLELRHNGQIVKAPFVATLTFHSRSAKDIPKSAFEGDPISVNFGVPIVDLIEETSIPGRSGVSTPKAVQMSTSLAVGPCLLTTDHRLHYTVLVDGRPTLGLQCALTDVEIVTESPHATRALPWYIYIAAFALSILSVVQTAMIPADTPAKILLAAFMGLMVGVLGYSAVEALRRRFK